MYVYLQSEKPGAFGDNTGLWTVGFYDPSGKWHPESDHANPKDAARRVAHLNGANVSFEE